MHWVEIASFEKIQSLLEIFEQERHHEVLLTVKNLHDLSRHLSPYNVLIILHPLPSKIVEGEHFVTVDLLNLILGSSSPAREVEIEAAGWELVISTQPVQLPLLARIPALPPKHLGRVTRVAVWSDFSVLHPEH